MRVLVACEFSGVVRDAFKARGHHAGSCDLLPSDRPGNHYWGDIFAYLKTPLKWDLSPVDLNRQIEGKIKHTAA